MLTIHSGTRNGERYDEDIIIDREKTERRGREQDVEITRRRSVSNMRGARSKKDMWTEVTKDLVIKEAIDEMGYDYEETADFFYVIDYLRYVSGIITCCCFLLHATNILIGGCPPAC